MRKLPLPSLFLLTDRTLLTPNWTLAQTVAPCITGGATIIVFREDDVPDKSRLVVFDFVRDGVGGRVPIIVSGSPEFAIKAGADGLQIEQTIWSGGSEAAQSPISAAREVLGPDRIVGVAISSLESLDVAQSGGADYALIVPDWTNPKSAVGIIGRYLQAASIPIIVGLDMPVACASMGMDCGAAGVAICSVGMASYDRTSAVREYWAALSRKLTEPL
jgi:thiamine-phosphate pyrophosphorylase